MAGTAAYEPSRLRYIFTQHTQEDMQVVGWTPTLGRISGSCRLPLCLKHQQPKFLQSWQFLQVCCEICRWVGTSISTFLRPPLASARPSSFFWKCEGAVSELPVVGKPRRGLGSHTCPSPLQSQQGKAEAGSLDRWLPGF